MGKRRNRRSWSDDEKREICQQTMVPGVSIAQVARRYAMNANQVHTWLKDERFAPEGLEDGFHEEEDDDFLEVDLSAYAAPTRQVHHSRSQPLAALSPRPALT